MTKFKVGDKVIFNKENEHVAKEFDYKANHPYKVKEVYEFSKTIRIINENGKNHFFEQERFELFKPKPTKNQRIAALEEEVAELKIILHELRERPQLTTVINNSIQEHSTTNNVEGVKHPEVKIKNSPTFMTAKEGAELGELISKGMVDGLSGVLEFEGQQYKKVDRLARKGDVVIPTKGHSVFLNKGKMYKVVEDVRVIDNCGRDTILYIEREGRTPETVDVYELIPGGLNPQIPMVDETIEPLTPNQQRAAIIENAKKFVEETEKYLKQIKADRTKGNYIYQEMANDLKFVINEEKRAITALLYNKFDKIKLNGKGIAKCKPSDVFNEHIGKAIALGRALGLDVSEFEQAVQPNKVVSGMKIKSTRDWPEAYFGKVYKGDIFEVVSDEVKKPGIQCHVNSAISRNSEIIDDTNAIY